MRNMEQRMGESNGLSWKQWMPWFLISRGSTIIMMHCHNPFHSCTQCLGSRGFTIIVCKKMKCRGAVTDKMMVNLSPTTSARQTRDEQLNAIEPFTLCMATCLFFFTSYTGSCRAMVDRHELNGEASSNESKWWLSAFQLPRSSKRKRGFHVCRCFWPSSWSRNCAVRLVAEKGGLVIWTKLWATLRHACFQQVQWPRTPVESRLGDLLWLNIALGTWQLGMAIPSEQKNLSMTLYVAMIPRSIQMTFLWPRLFRVFLCIKWVGVVKLRNHQSILHWEFVMIRRRLSPRERKSYWRHHRMIHRCNIDRWEWVTLYQPDFYMEPNLHAIWWGVEDFSPNLDAKQYGSMLQGESPLDQVFFIPWLAKSINTRASVGLRDPRLYYPILPANMCIVFYNHQPTVIYQRLKILSPYVFDVSNPCISMSTPVNDGWIAVWNRSKRGMSIHMMVNS